LFPEYWNQKKQEVNYDAITETEQFTKNQARDIEAKFEEIKDFILRKSFGMSDPVTREWLQSVLDEFYNKDKPKRGKETLNEYIQRFIDEAENGKRLANVGNTKKKYSYGSLRILRGFMLSFNLFQGIDTPGVKSRGKQYPKQPYKPLNWDDITIDTYNSFVKYFYSRGCSGNYIGKHLKSFKTIMRIARDEGLHNNNTMDLKAFKSISEETNPIYLTEAELKALFDLKLSDFNLTPLETGLKPSDIKRLPEVRDVFLVGCYTAQRYSDYSRINKSMIRKIEGGKVIELIQQKTGTKCIIPVRPECDAILKRYDYTLPKTYEQQVNKGIKLIGKLAKIKEMIQEEKNKGGLTVKTSVNKYDLIKTHCARRTGCTLMYLAGIPSIDIMKISGHKTEKEFLKYIRVSREETATKLIKHPYFMGNMLKAVQ
jgi:hypothetical protein